MDSIPKSTALPYLQCLEIGAQDQFSIINGILGSRLLCLVLFMPSLGW